jgi:hypothetical protein
MIRFNVVFLKIVATCLSLLAVVDSAAASTVTAAGHAYDVGLGVYNYDKDGYLFFGTDGPNSGPGGATGSISFGSSVNTVSNPSYISGYTAGALSNEAHDFGYSNIQPMIGNTVESGVAFFGGAVSGTEYHLMDITFGSGPLPPEVQIGVLLNAESSFDQSPSALRLQGPGGPSDSASLVVSHAFSASQPQGGNDLYFFDVEPTAGSTFELFATAGPFSPFAQVTIAGLTFVAVPEPS